VTKQGDPENLRRKFASKGSSPRHLCIEQALNLADRYRRVGRLSTCGCIQVQRSFASIGHPWASPPASWAIILCSSASSSQYRRATLRIQWEASRATTSPDHPNHECVLLCKVSRLGASKVVDPHQFVTALLLWTLPGSLWWILT
jgi:hypothetical protein